MNKLPKTIERAVGEKFKSPWNEKLIVRQIDNGVHYCGGCRYYLGGDAVRLCEGHIAITDYCTKDNRDDNNNVIFVKG